MQHASANENPPPHRAPLSGFIYEKNILSLFAIRCALDKTIKDFKIGTNLQKDFGSLDDIIIHVEHNDGEKEMFVCQLKHKNDPNLNLNKFITDYRSIKRQHENVKINIIIHTIVQKNFITQHKALEDVSLPNSKLKMFNTNEEGLLHKYTRKGLNISDKSITEDMIHDFLTNCFVFSKQSNKDELIDIIRKEFKESVKDEQFQLILTYFDSFYTYIKGKKFISKEEIVWMLKVKILYPFVDQLLENVNDNNCIENGNLIIETLNLFHLSTLSDESITIILRIITKIIETRFDIKNFSKELWHKKLPENITFEEPYYQALKYIKNNELLYKDLIFLLWLKKEAPLPLIYTHENKQQINFVFQHFLPNSSVVLRNKTKFNISMENLNIFIFNNIRMDLKEKNLDLIKIKLHPEESISLKELNFTDGITPDEYVKLCSAKEISFKASDTKPFYIPRKLEPLIFNENVFKNTNFLFVVHPSSSSPYNEEYLNSIFKKIRSKLGSMQSTFQLSTDRHEHHDNLLELSDFLKIRSTDIQFKYTTVYSKESIWKTRTDLKDKFRGSYCCLLEFHGNFLCHAYNGDIETLSQFKVNESINENELLELNLPISIIHGNAGMGKSSMLHNMEYILPTEYCVVNLTNNNTWGDKILNDKKMLIEHLLIHQVGTEMFNRFKQFFTELFENRIINKKMYIIKDAFDETNAKTNVVDQISNLLQVPIVISTRPTMKNILENELHAPSLSVIQFSREDQIQFLQQSNSLSADYIVGVIDELKVKKSFLGVPLLLKLLVEILPDLNEIKNINLIVLYDEYLKKYIKHYRNRDKDTIKSLAFRIFFKQHFSNFFNEKQFKRDFEDFQKTIQETKDNIIGGFNIEEEPLFIHRTFAEFLCAQYLSEICLENNFINIFEEILKDINLDQVKYFFDLILCQDLPLHFAALRNDVKHLSMMNDDDNIIKTDRFGRTVLHIVATYGSYDNFIRNPKNFINSISFTKKSNPFINADIIMDTLLKKSFAKNIIFDNFDKLNNNVINYIWITKGLNILNTICINVIDIDINLPTSYEDEFLCIIMASDRYELLNVLMNQPYIKEKIIKNTVKFLDQEINSLYLSINNNSVGITKLLIRNGININKKNRYGLSALSLAAINGDLEIVKDLIENGAEINAQEINNFSPLKFAVNGNHTKIAEFLINQGADVNLRDSKHYRTALHVAAASGNVKMANVLVSKGADINAQDINGNSPLMFAVDNNHTETAEFLINQGADVNLRDSKHYRTALHVAAASGNVKMANVLVSNGADINAQDINGNSPLMFAVDNNHTETAEFLINQGANVNLRDSKDKRMALHVAAATGNVEIANVLVSNGADTNAQDINRYSPLMFAVDNNHTETVEFLINQGADVNLRGGENNRTALDFVAATGNVKMANVLVSNGADINAQDINGYWPLMFAIITNQTETAEFLINQGADVNLGSNKDKRTVLHEAAFTGNVTMANVLVSNGADLNAQDINGYSPLMFAVDNNHTEIAEFLINQGADVNLRGSKDNRTALHVAAATGNVKMANVLVSNGADINAQDINEMSPIFTAQSFEYQYETAIENPPHRGPLSGFTYEKNILSLFAIRCALDKTIKDFKIGTNLKNFGSLDDIIIDVEHNDGEKEMFVCQLKHKNDPNLNLNKFITDYRSIKRQHENVKINIIIHTIVQKNLITQHKALEDVSLSNSKLKMFNTNEEGLLHKYTGKGLNISDKSITEDMIHDFLTNCFVFSKQSNKDELIDIIRKEFKESVKDEQFQLILTYFDSFYTYIKGKKFISKEEIVWMLKVKILYPFVDQLLENVNDNNCIENGNLIIETLNLFHLSTLSDESITIILRIITKIIETHFDIKNFSKELWHKKLPENITFEEPYYQALKYIKNNELLYKDLIFLLWLKKEAPLPLIYTHENKQQINFVFQHFLPNSSVVLRNKTKFNISMENLNIFIFNNIRMDLKENNLDLIKIKLHPEESISLKELNFTDGITPDEYVKLCSAKEISFKASDTKPFYIPRKLEPLIFNENVFKNTNFLFVVHPSSSSPYNEEYLNSLFKKIRSKLGSMESTFQLSTDRHEHQDNLLELSDFLKIRSTDIQFKYTTVYSKESIWKTRTDLKDKFRGSYCCLLEFHGHFLCHAYNGDIETLSQFKVNESINENELLELNFPISIIHGNAGMGKSSMLHNMEYILPKEYCVVNLTNIWDDKILNDKKMLIEHLLIHQVGTEMFNRFKQFFTELFENRIINKKLYIIKDAFDETNQKTNVVNQISNLLQVPIVISTRPTMKNILENELHAPSLNVIQFSREDQIQFLQQSNSLSADYIIGVIDELKVEKSFLGVPLLLKLLVEILPDLNEIKNINLIVLYDKYLKKYMKHYRNRDEDTIKSLAFRIFFKHHFSNFFNEKQFKRDFEDFQKTVQETKDNIIGGFNIEEEPIFIHRTFAEFLCAQYLSEICLENNFRNIFEEILKDINLDQVKYFFDLILCQDLPLHFAALRNDVKHLSMMNDDDNIIKTDRLGRTVLHIVATYGSYDNFIRNPIDYRINISFTKKSNPFINADIIMDTLLKKSFAKNIIFDNFDKLNNNVINYIWLTKGLNILNTICIYVIDINLPKSNEDEFLCIIMASNRYKLLKVLMNQPYIKEKIIKNTIEFLDQQINALHLSVFNNSVDITKLLIRNGVNINKNNRYGVSALSLATINGNLEIVKDLVRNHADINAQDIDGLSPLMFAVDNNHTETAEYLINQGADVNLRDSKYTGTALHFAAATGNVEIAKVLLSKKADIDAQDINGNSPLMFAVSNNHTETAKFLINQGADVNLRDSKDNATALHDAALTENVEIANVLLSKDADIDAQDINGKSPLIFAVSNNHTETAKFLINKGADVNLRGSKDNATALHDAAATGNVEIAKVLLSKDADIDAQDINEFSPLMFAVNKNHTETAKFLINHGADVNLRSSKYNATALHDAAATGNVEIAKVLLSKKADIDAQDINGNSPLMFAVNKNHTETAEFLINQGANVNLRGSKDKIMALHVAAATGNVEIVNVLVSNGADIDAQDINGKSPLIYAVRKNHTETAKFLINKGADVNLRGSKDNATALHDAAATGNVEIAKVLLSKDADIDAQDINGCSPLIFAVSKNHTETAKFLINQGADVNLRDSKDNATALHDAALTENVEIANVLLSKDADIDAQDINGKSPLIFAVSNNHTETAKFLINKGADVNLRGSKDNATALHDAAATGNVEIAKVLLSKDADIDAQDINGYSPLMFAVIKNHTETAKFLINHGADVNLRSSKYNRTALHDAAATGNVEIAKVLLSKDADIDAQDINGYSPLMFAVNKNHTETAKFLINHGADVNLRSSKYNSTALHDAAATENVEIAKVLLSKDADIDAQDINGYSPLMFAVIKNHTETAKFLINKGADVNLRGSKSNATALHVAAATGNVEIAKVLLSKDADIDAQDINGYSPLIYAVRKNHTETAKFLINKGADVNLRGSKDNATALHDAAATGNVEIANVLVSNGADINAQDINGYSPLMCAVSNNHTETAESLINQGADVKLCCSKDKRMALHVAAATGNVKIAKVLLSNGADINAQDINGYSPLMFAVIKNHTETAEFLINQGADVNLRGSKDNRTALQAAAATGNVEIANVLVSNGADINAQDIKGKSPLMFAVNKNHTETAEFLINHGADVNLRGSKDNRTALHVAGLTGNVEMANVLVSNGADINAQDINGYSPLIFAVDNNHTKITEYLINHGADVNLRGSKDNRTALHVAGLTGNVEMANVLVSNGADINAQDINGYSPLMFAVYKNHTETVEFLINQGADVNLRGSKDNRTALHVAAATGNIEMSNVLVSNGADINAQDINGYSPLMFAVDNNHPETAEFLINQGVDVNLRGSKDNRTALHVAAATGNVKMANVLVSNGADINAQDINGYWPLMFAFITNQTETAEFLINQGADVNLGGNKDKRTVLHEAAFTGNVTMANVLVSNGADLNAQDINGYSPLMFAVDNNHTETAEFLINQGANVNLRGSKDNRTALHVAAATGNVTMANVLVSNGADINAQDINEMSPLFTAVSLNHAEIVELLLANTSIREK
ncbi:unnamed protein product [Brassicogethes aeneus]|uniref:Ankyrin repeat protein n=1 Tax=Brassicogethes aeneus TaxID=1431903 RepID=A0A9P0ATK6_BRAAE|nr:unnamed protein product [Brassicogethes aeneus]